MFAAEKSPSDINIGSQVSHCSRGNSVIFCTSKTCTQNSFNKVKRGYNYITYLIVGYDPKGNCCHVEAICDKIYYIPHISNVFL